MAEATRVLQSRSIGCAHAGRPPACSPAAGYPCDRPTPARGMQAASSVGMPVARSLLLATLVATSCAPSPVPTPDAVQGDPDPDPPDPAAGCTAGTHACGGACMP